MNSTASVEVDDSRRAEGLARRDRFQPVILLLSIAVGIGVGHLTPDIAERLAAGVTVGVFVLIFAVMLGVDVAEVTHAWRNRRFVAVAIGINFVVHPVLAVLIGEVLLSGRPGLRLGLLLFLITPCIGWYLAFTDIAGGDTNLAVSILVPNIVLQILLLPVYVLIFVGDEIAIDAGTVASSVAAFLVIPAVLAAVLRRTAWRGDGDLDVARRRLHLPTVKTVALSVVIVSMFGSQASEIIDNPGVFTLLIAPFTVFFVAAYALAVWVGRRSGLPEEHTTTLVFTTTSRNSEASLAIAATAFTNPLVALTVALGPVIELPLLTAMAHARRRRHDGETSRTADEVAGGLPTTDTRRSGSG